MIIVKQGASIKGCRKEILEALPRIDPIFSREKVDTVVTSGKEKYRHSAKRSAHYRGDAVDLRSKHRPTDRKHPVLAFIAQELGDDFVVLFEAEGKPWEHYHVHWSPIFDATEFAEH